ncbi:hypothetical protein CEXT_26031 [Caerostris extrusa]|uniref:Uncharacterized protein n=1 Tax=Caerostris extrusa TaxID=172846 RepID=A0AAV4YA73_CAEEX|nr:hypothetical protein CEXT_26031 [Caerostris extrusa]
MRSNLKIRQGTLLFPCLTVLDMINSVGHNILWVQEKRRCVRTSPLNIFHWRIFVPNSVEKCWCNILLLFHIITPRADLDFLE